MGNCLESYISNNQKQIGNLSRYITVKGMSGQKNPKN